MNYKINQIKRLIESLDSYEIRELTDYLMEEENVDVNNLNVFEIAKKIRNGELPETKELLMKIDETGWSVALWLAFYSHITNWKTDDKEILMLRIKKNRWSVAHQLADNSHMTNWKTNDKDILMLQTSWGESVAHVLAKRHPTWTTNDPEILSLTDDDEKTVEDILREEGKI